MSSLDEDAVGPVLDDERTIGLAEKGMKSMSFVEATQQSNAGSGSLAVYLLKAGKLYCAYRKSHLQLEIGR